MEERGRTRGTAAASVKVLSGAKSLRGLCRRRMPRGIVPGNVEKEGAALLALSQ